ncbi:hypothetical protein ACFQ88_18555 [Paenibacillus sp. NPDC056579]|uniref:hypothetical protein n=1 Tax=Paenibacillus sp. NPDC056579 TaxID=3345871 RepID=UPI0036C94923
MENDSFSGLDLLKLLLIVPFILVAYFVMYFIGGYLLLLFTNGLGSSDFRFIMMHLYLDVLCAFVPVYYSCILAPRFKLFIAFVFMVIIASNSGLYTETLGNAHVFIPSAWKALFTQIAVICAAVIPFLLLFGRYVLKTKLDRSADM